MENEFDKLAMTDGKLCYNKRVDTMFSKFSIIHSGQNFIEFILNRHFIISNSKFNCTQKKIIVILDEICGNLDH